MTRLSDIEPGFVYTARGKRGADVRPLVWAGARGRRRWRRLRYVHRWHSRGTEAQSVEVPSRHNREGNENDNGRRKPAHLESIIWASCQ